MKFIDFHCDTIYKIATTGGSLKENSYSIDSKKLKNSLAQFFAAYIDISKTSKPFEFCNNLIDIFESSIKECDNLCKATNFNQYLKNKNSNKTSAFLSIEGGEALEGSIDNLYHFYNRGVRLLTLTWNFENEIGYPNIDYKFKDKPLKKFGIELIHEMDNLNMIIDVSHLSDGGFNSVIEESTGTIIASHSNCRSLVNHPRNLEDYMIKAIGNRGGIVGINFYNKFLGTNEVSTIEDMVRHIIYLYNVGGSDIVALGSDYDGIDCDVEMKNFTEIYKLYDELRKHFSEDIVDKFFYKNGERIIKSVHN